MSLRRSATVIIVLSAVLAGLRGPRQPGGIGRGANADALAPVRGQAGDFWADVILGQRDFSEVTGNRVVAHRLFNPNGVLVDRTTVPNRVYVYDAGNNRVLGLSHLGVCAAGPNAGRNCTSRSDCPSSICRLDRDRPASIVLGQPDLVDHSACNGDSGFQTYPVSPPATERTLCLLRVDQMSIGEGGSAATMAVDAAGNLYVPDFFNHRVLRYDQPFDTDGVADQVWGQADFNGHECNRGAGPGAAPDASGLCLAPPNGQGTIEAGVAVDADGNLWVTDKMNHRVLRYPRGAGAANPSGTADLVLGQRDMSGHARGAGLEALNAPGAVRVDRRGVVFVADTYNSRLLAYEPPLRSGMSASYMIGSGLNQPSGLNFGPDGDLWVNDSFNRRLLRFRGQSLMQDLSFYASGDWGGPGIDRDGDLLQSGWTFQSVLHHVPARRRRRRHHPGCVPAVVGPQLPRRKRGRRRPVLCHQRHDGGGRPTGGRRRRPPGLLEPALGGHQRPAGQRRGGPARPDDASPRWLLRALGARSRRAAVGAAQRGLCRRLPGAAVDRRHSRHRAAFAAAAGGRRRVRVDRLVGHRRPRRGPLRRRAVGVGP